MHAQLHTDKLLTAREVGERLQIHPRSVWRLASAGQLPPPVRITDRIVRWRPEDIERALEKAQRAR